MENRFVTTARVDEDAQYEAGLRPRTLDEYIGQDRVRENLQVAIAAARQRGEALDHVLLSGPPGLGKTTLACVIANELGVAVRPTAGPVIEKPGDLAGLLTSLQEREVLFIDEIHRMAPAIEEILYPAMEDYEIVGRSARILNVPIDDDAAVEIARRSRGTPRIANRLLRRVRDYAEVRADGAITLQVARAGLAVYDVDELGLDRVDRAVLTALVRTFGGGPVGVSTLAVAVGEEPATVEEVCEPFLVRAGMLARTPRGRVATAAAWRHLKSQPPPDTPGDATPTLFDG